MEDFKKGIIFVWQYGKDNKYRMLLYAFLNIIKIISNVFIPILSAKLIVNLTQSELKQLLFVAGIIFIIGILNRVVDYFSEKIADKIYYSISNNVRNKLGEEILKIENKTLDNNSSGIFIQRLTSDVERLSDIFGMLLAYIEGMLAGLGVFIAVFIINKIVFVYFVIYLLIIYFINDKRLKVRQKNRKLHRDKYEKLTGFIGELVRGNKDIKMLNSEKSFQVEMDKKIDDNNKISYYTHIVNLKYLLVRNITKESLNFVLIVLLISLINMKLVTITIALVLYNYSEKISSVMTTITGFFQIIKDFTLSSDNILEIIENKKFPKEKFGNRHLDVVKGNFEFKNVTFKYDEKGNNILNKLSFKINENETIGFVGKTGAGKTTIFNLLCKMYQIDSGKITIDGVNINELDKDSVRGNITIISQNPYIFNVSIKDNFKLVKQNVTMKEIRNACKTACLDDYIMSLPHKYNTIVGEGGVTLSGGQRQRLAIARALIQNTKIILFDEATSALDNETQSEIQEAILNMKGNYTILIIAHRLSTIINCDKIMVLSDGKIVGEGKHRELLNSCSEYKKLYESEIKNEL